MRVGLVYSSHRFTGIGRVTLEIAERLSPDPEHRVDPIYLNFSDRTVELHKNANRQVLAKLRRLPEYKYFFYLRAQRRVPPYDLYHISTQNLSFLSLRPKVVTCHDIIHLVHPESPFHYLFGKAAYVGLRDAERVITVSESTKRDVMSHYGVPPERIRVIPSGVDHDTFNQDVEIRPLFESYELSQNHRYILHVSSERPHKNLDGLMRAFSVLKRKPGMENVKLLKGGEAENGWYRTRTMNLVRNLGLEGDVLFMGGISDATLAQLYRLASVFVLPSYYEGFGLPLLEAMACGTPVITSNTSSMPEVVGDAGIVHPPDDTQGLSEAMFEVLTDPLLHRRLVESGIRRAAMFTWDRSAQETMEVYQEVAS